MESTIHFRNHYAIDELHQELGLCLCRSSGWDQSSEWEHDFGDVQAFLQYTNQFSQPITQIASLLNTIQSTVASAERVFEVLDEEEMSDEPSGLPVEESDYKVRFDHVQSGYTPDNLLMTDFNLDVKAGEMVAIVGPTGAGKTTLINLLERFYDVSGGSIRYDGRDTRDLTRDELRSNISMVLQDTWLFTGSIYDNIHYGNDKATKEQVIEAAKAAHVDDFVRKLPDGYDTVLNEEASNISRTTTIDYDRACLLS